MTQSESRVTGVMFFAWLNEDKTKIYAPWSSNFSDTCMTQAV